MNPYFPDPTPTGVRLPTSFLDHLEAAARRREVLELRDPTGKPLAALPLFRIPPGASPELYGVSTTAPPEDRIVVVAHRRGAAGPTWELELVTGAWTYANRGKDPTPVLAPAPAFQVTAALPLVRVELLAWAARLGVQAVIRYGGDPAERLIGDLRIVHQGPIRATDLVKEAPRAFSLAKVTELVGATMTWTADAGYSRLPAPPSTPHARRA